MSPGRGAQGRREPETWVDRIDWSVVARGASRGFTVLVLTDLLFLVIGRLSPIVSLVWLIAGSIAGFALAAWNAGAAIAPAMTGAVAALFSFTLTVPLIYMVSGTAKIPLNWAYLAALGVGAVVVGAAVGRHQGNQLPPAQNRRR